MSGWGVVLNVAVGGKNMSDQHLLLEEVAFE